MIDYVKAKRHYIMALAILFVVVSLSGPTYSLFINVDTTEDFTYNTGILDLQIIEDEQISLQNALPIIDSEGIVSEPYELIIKNVGTLPYKFDLKMLSSTEENTLDTKYIKFQVNENKPTTLYSANNVIASSVMIYPNEEKTFKVKIWLDINTPNAQMGKVFIAKIATTGEATYKTLDSSGANKPELLDGMLPVYYDQSTNTWKKADVNNTDINHEWYNYSNKKWANVVMLNSSNKQIYDITGNNNIKLDEARTNNGNYVSDEEYLNLKISNYNYDNISNIFRIKFNDISPEKIYIISNDKMAYYYDTKIKKFIFEIDDKIVTSETFEIKRREWHILGYTYNGNKVNFYIDGNKISSSNINGNISSNESFKIGTDKLGKEISNMEIGDIYIYKTILTDTEINTNYQTNINPIYNNLVAGYNEFEPKTINEYYRSENVGTTIKNEHISSYFVWIPRFKYKLWNVTGTKGIDSYNAYKQGIEIEFEKDNESSGVIRCQNNICYSDELLITKVTNNDNGKYYTHPAFTNGNEEVPGIWVSKYEISTNNELCKNGNELECLSNNLKIESKPGNNAWRNNYLSYFYQNIKTLDQNNNYHVIKNTEWGAITYLSHSNFGLCENNTCKSIGTNKTYISGNEVTDSTTNNMYGVFDLAGSATEFVMANYTNSNGKLTLNDTHFDNIKINEFDYDLYQKDNFILGDATKELTLNEGIWYNNYNSFINETNNWFIRGGIGVTQNNGIFYYNGTTDTNSEYITTRIVIK